MRIFYNNYFLQFCKKKLRSKIFEKPSCAKSVRLEFQIIYLWFIRASCDMFYLYLFEFVAFDVLTLVL